MILLQCHEEIIAGIGRGANEPLAGQASGPRLFDISPHVTYNLAQV